MLILVIGLILIEHKLHKLHELTQIISKIEGLLNWLYSHFIYLK